MNIKTEARGGFYTNGIFSHSESNHRPESPRTALDYLDTFPQVTGHEVTQLVDSFHQSAESIASDETLTQALFERLKHFNPYFISAIYSTDLKANILANVVAAIYAPLIHNFNLALLKNVQRGVLAPNIIAPPRDTIPFVKSLQIHAASTNVAIRIFEPYVNRHTAGIANNQVLKDPIESPHLRTHLEQMVANVPLGQSFTEIEPGIYSTLSMKVSRMLKEMGYEKLAALKFYGLGPNLSYVHGVLSNGQEWIAEKAEKAGLVDPKEVAGLMILLDSLEEFGMQNAFESVENLIIDVSGRVVPVIIPTNEDDQEISAATNRAVIDTASIYRFHNPQLVKHLLKMVPEMAQDSRDQGLPLTLSAIIPPDDKQIKLGHFEEIRNSFLLNYPQGLVL